MCGRVAFAEFDAESVSNFTEKQMASISMELKLDLGRVRGIIENSKRILEVYIYIHFFLVAFLCCIQLSFLLLFQILCVRKLMHEKSIISNAIMSEFVNYDSTSY